MKTHSSAEIASVHTPTSNRNMQNTFKTTEKYHNHEQ